MSSDIVWAVVGAVAAVFTLVAYAYLVEPRWLRVRRQTVFLDNWPPALDGLTLLHISDLHLGARPGHVDPFLRRASSVGADILVFTGDYIRDPEAVERTAEVLRPVIGSRPAYGILGNHEHAVYGFTLPRKRNFNKKRRLDSGKIAETLGRSGMTMLANSRLTVPCNGTSFTLAGIDDMFNGASDLSAALEGLESTDSTMLLSHSPDILAEASERKIPLVLSGHTHGGQVRFPPFGTPTTATRFPLERPSGILRRGSTTMHISPGLGLSWPPVRFFARPEITVLELRARPEES